MKIKKVSVSDVPAIFTFVKAAISKMISQGIFQWDEIYPTQEDFIADAPNNQLYIVEIEEKAAACFVLNKDCDEEYKNGTWSYTGDDYVVIHRLCVNPEFQNQGVGQKTCLMIEELVKPQEVKAIKLDCFTQNPYSLKMYEKLGYKIVGYADWRKGRFALMEKVL